MAAVDEAQGSPDAAPRRTPKPPKPPSQRRGTLLAQDRRLGYGLIAPAIILLLGITAYPLVYNIWNSFHYAVPSIPFINGKLAGLANFRRMFAVGSVFTPALLHTVVFTVVSVAIEVTVGLVLALALNKPFRGRGLVRAAVFIPWAVPTVVSAEVWKEMFDPQQGFVDYALKLLHLPGSGTTWLANGDTSWVALFVADAWKNTPFVAIILIGGLQVIPAEIYEAARIDGASSWRQFRRLTLPLLKPALMVALIFRTLSAFLVFDVVYIMSNGGPGTSTETLAYLDFNAFHVDNDYGFGGAISLVLIVLCLLIAGAYTRIFRERA
jgi:ABC-type sugar transport system permease subunit